MNKIIKFIKNSASIVVAVITIILLIAPYIILVFYLRRNGQTIQIYPKFKIKSIDRNENIDSTILENAIKHAEEIYKKIRNN